MDSSIHRAEFLFVFIRYTEFLDGFIEEPQAVNPLFRVVMAAAPAFVIQAVFNTVQPVLGGFIDRRSEKV